MKKRKFLWGFVSGFVSCFLILLLFAWVGLSMEETSGLTLFDQPRDCVDTGSADEITVFQGWHNGGLANIGGLLDRALDEPVFLVNDGDIDYYDGQVFKITSGTCIRHVGMYRYRTHKDEIYKTVAAVRLENLTINID